MKALNSSGIFTGLIGGAAMAWAGVTWMIDPWNPSERWIGLAFAAIGVAIAVYSGASFAAAVRRGRARDLDGGA